MTKKIKKIKEKIKEDIRNIPNLLTLIRVILTFVIFYLIFGGFSLVSVGIIFAIGMITDGLDGYIARKFNQKTEFGRKFDMVADRFLMIGTIFAIIIYNVQIGVFDRYELLMIFLVISREIIGFPFAITAFFSGKHLPKVRLVGKLTTVLQGFTFPIILFGWYIAIYLSVLTAIVGIIAGMTYIYDTQKLELE